MHANTTKRLVALFILLAAILVAVWGWVRPEHRGTGAIPARIAAPSNPTEAPVMLQPARAFDRRADAESRAPLSAGRVGSRAVAPTVAARQEDLAVGMVRGRVFDIDGQPVAEVSVETTNTRRDGRSMTAVTDKEGGFEIHVTDPYELLVVEAEGWITVRHAEVTLTSRAVIHPIVVAPVIRASGIVLDEQGERITGAPVELVLPRQAFARISAPLDTTRQGSWGQRSAADGSFSFEALPAVPGAFLQVRQKEFNTWRDAAPTRSTQDLHIVLIRANGAQRSRRLEGFVRHERDGTPAGGASVHLGRRQSRTDSQGHFALALSGVEPDANLVAALPGYEPAVRLHFGAEVAAIEGEMEPVTLWLPGPALEITGRLMTTDDQPCGGWQMKLLNGTETNPATTPPMFAEDFAAGGSFVQTTGGVGGQLQASSGAARMRARPRGTTPNMQETDPQGAFTMSGLRRGHSYVLRAWNEETLQSIESEPVLAGTRGYILRVPTDAFRDLVWGHVRGLDGTPIENVRVRLTMRVHRTRSGTSFHTGQEVHTGPDGAFRFTDVPRVDLILRFTGAEVDSLYLDFEAGDTGKDVAVRIARRCHFRYDGPTDADGPTTLRVIDRYGDTLRLARSAAGSSSGSSRFAIAKGQSGVLGVSERGEWLILERGGEEVERRHLDLQPGEVFVVH